MLSISELTPRNVFIDRFVVFLSIINHKSSNKNKKYIYIKYINVDNKISSKKKSNLKKLQKRGSLFIDCRKRKKKRFVVVDDIHDIQFSRKLTPFWRNPLHINKRGSAIEWRSFVIDRDPIDGYCFTVSNHARIFRNFSNSSRGIRDETDDEIDMKLATKRLYYSRQFF